MPNLNYDYYEIALDQVLDKKPVPADTFKYFKCLGIGDLSVNLRAAFGIEDATRIPLSAGFQFTHPDNIGSVYLWTDTASGVAGAKARLFLSEKAEVSEDATFAANVIRRESLITRVDVTDVATLVPAAALEGRHSVMVANMSIAESGEAEEAVVEVVNLSTDVYGVGYPIGIGGEKSIDIESGIPLYLVAPTGLTAHVAIWEGK